jgi:hypothetical protein
MTVLVIAILLEIRSVGWWEVSEGGDIGDSHWRKEPYPALLGALDTFCCTSEK